MGAATTALGPAVYASAGVPAATGSFRSWHAAQQAAGFRLRRPTRRHGLTRSGKIVVARCMVTGRLSKRQVFAAYGKASHRFPQAPHHPVPHLAQAPHLLPGVLAQ